MSAALSSRASLPPMWEASNARKLCSTVISLECHRFTQTAFTFGRPLVVKSHVSQTSYSINHSLEDVHVSGFKFACQLTSNVGLECSFAQPCSASICSTDFTFTRKLCSRVQLEHVVIF